MKTIVLATLAGAFALATVHAKEVGKAAPQFVANALDGVLAGKDVSNAMNKPYGCGVKY
jgi:outer membrane lipoprotein SlyB